MEGQPPYRRVLSFLSAALGIEIPGAIILSDQEKKVRTEKNNIIIQNWLEGALAQEKNVSWLTLPEAIRSKLKQLAEVIRYPDTLLGLEKYFFILYDASTEKIITSDIKKAVLSGVSPVQLYDELYSRDLIGIAHSHPNNTYHSPTDLVALYDSHAPVSIVITESNTIFLVIKPGSLAETASSNKLPEFIPQFAAGFINNAFHLLEKNPQIDKPRMELTKALMKLSANMILTPFNVCTRIVNILTKRGGNDHFEEKYNEWVTGWCKMTGMMVFYGNVNDERLKQIV